MQHSVAVWERARHWVLPAAHALAAAVTVKGRSQAVFHSSLGRPHFGWLIDHRVFDRALFPGAAYFEAAGVAARSLLLGQSQNAALLTAATISAPLVLPEPGSGAPPVLECIVDLESSALEVASQGRSGSVRHVSAQIRAGLLPKKDAPQPQHASPSQTGKAKFQ